MEMPKDKRKTWRSLYACDAVGGTDNDFPHDIECNESFAMCNRMPRSRRTRPLLLSLKYCNNSNLALNYTVKYNIDYFG
jgi:hypothetical protein